MTEELLSQTYVSLDINLYFFLSSDLDETFKYCTLHYISNLLVVFIFFTGNRVDASIRGILRFRKSWNPIWHVGPTTDRKSYLRRWDSEVWNPLTLCVLILTPGKCYPVGDLRWGRPTLEVDWSPFPKALSQSKNSGKCLKYSSIDSPKDFFKFEISRFRLDNPRFQHL